MLSHNQAKELSSSQEFMLCTELRESVSITIFSSLFLLAHLSAIRIAISYDE